MSKNATNWLHGFILKFNYSRRPNKMPNGIRKDIREQNPSDDESDYEVDKEFYQKQNDTKRPQSIPTGMYTDSIKQVNICSKKHPFLLSTHFKM